ncbi:endolytic transglycosylase MltG [Virgibacillus xinjiangensis]|uniref:Endolytic murein transglycosylase n=1 Tax=Virgibacillus xinjiangensis TaxID=393090 RepID=A0ABV7CS92_9BACI
MYRNKRKKKYRENLKEQTEEAKRVRKIVFIIAMTVAVFLIIGAVSLFLYVHSAMKPVDPDSEEEVTIEVPIGSSSSTIASILEENGLIRNELVFRMYVKFNNETDFQAGEYTFSPSMEIQELVESLKNGIVMAEPVHTITIPEGLTIDQIAEIYGENLHFSKEDFLEKVNDRAYIEELMQHFPGVLSDDILDEEIRTPLEGYLFASTYDFYEEKPKIENIVEKMLTETEKLVNQYKAEIDEMGWNVHEAVTFASLVEKEAGKIEQRNKIAGVFYNRMEEEMPLQTDPTVLYALGEHKDQVLYEDLEIESPYNTYVVEALPIGPISNFAENSLEAVANPDQSDYLYFLHDSDGQIHYAETYEEHLQNREEHMEE